MDAGFEALVCDFEAAGVVEAVVANVTVPGKGSRRDLPDDPTRAPPKGNGDIYAERYGKTSPAHYSFVQADREHRDKCLGAPVLPPKR